MRPRSPLPVPSLPLKGNELVCFENDTRESRITHTVSGRGRSFGTSQTHPVDLHERTSPCNLFVECMPHRDRGTATGEYPAARYSVPVFLNPFHTRRPMAWFERVHRLPVAERVLAPLDPENTLAAVFSAERREPEPAFEKTCDSPRP